MKGPLVLCAMTLPRASLRERATAARAGGFAAVSLTTGDYARTRADGLSDTDIRALLADEGLAVTDVEALAAWRPGLAPRRPEQSEEAIFAVAEAVGAAGVSVVEGAGELAVEAAADAFGALCDPAAARGLRLHIEFWPGSALDLATAWDIVRAAERPNGGLMVDTWHLARTRGGEALLRDIPGERVTAVQISDSAPVDGPEDDYLAAALGDRLVPGEGSLDLVGFLRLLDSIGCRAPLGVEVCSRRLATEPAIAVARRLGDAMRDLIARAAL
jgi:sugar phosphate isomerase/epimerase